MKKNLKKLIALALTLTAGLSILSGCGAKDNKAQNEDAAKTSASGTVTLTYAIWDKNQEPGMRAIADAFEAKNPNIKIKVEVTPWDQYWTKLEAGATGGALPDVFWMHTKSFLRYSSGNMLLDLTDRIKNSKNISMDKFPKGLVDLYTNDGKNFGIPKDYDTIALWYNKTLFDEKNIPYPDETWDWNKLVEVAKQLTDPEKGIYGYIAPNEQQQGTHNFIYQNGGYIISDDKKKTGYDLPETKEALQFYQDLILKHKVSPTIAQFADTGFAQYFESGKAAMGLFGSWMLSEFNANEYVRKNCDIAVIPQGKKKATIYNGLANAISAKTKYPEEAWKFVEFMGGEEANKIQAEKGAAIPAYKGTEQAWIDSNKNFNLKAYPEMLSYGVLFANSKTKEKWEPIEIDITKKILSGELTVEEGANQLDKEIEALLATE